jgi:hypothetical protein
MIVALIDRQHLAPPYYGSRRKAALLGDPRSPCQPQTLPAYDALMALVATTSE